jgi:hypothetical protein
MFPFGALLALQLIALMSEVFAIRKIIILPEHHITEWKSSGFLSKEIVASNPTLEVVASSFLEGSKEDPF